MACAAAAGVPTTADGLPDDVDIALVFTAAARMRVLPVLAWYARTQRWARPEWFAEIAGATLARFDARNQQLVDEAARIARALEDAGIVYAFRKGVHLCHLYPSRGLRPFSDIDVLIHAGTEAVVGDTLSRLGYEAVPVTRHQRAFFAIATNASPGYVLRQASGDVFVDLSSALLLPALAEAWASGRNLDLASVELDEVTGDVQRLRTLASPYALVDLVVNLYIGATTMRYVNRLRFQRLTPYMDVLAVARRLGDDGGHAFRTQVDALGLHDAVSFAFGNGERLFGPGSFSPYWPVDTGTPILDEYGRLEFGSPQRWDVPLLDRMFLDGLPRSVPSWTSPI
jgi:hypothetical protein